jgi:hypothetical protein
MIAKMAGYAVGSNQPYGLEAARGRRTIGQAAEMVWPMSCRAFIP